MPRLHAGDLALVGALASVLWCSAQHVLETGLQDGVAGWGAAVAALLSAAALAVYLPTMTGPYQLLRTLATSGRDDAELSAWWLVMVWAGSIGGRG